MLYRLTDEQVKNIITIIKNVPAQGKMEELEIFIAKNKEIIKALEAPIKENE